MQNLQLIITSYCVSIMAVVFVYPIQVLFLRMVFKLAQNLLHLREGQFVLMLQNLELMSLIFSDINNLSHK